MVRQLRRGSLEMTHNSNIHEHDPPGQSALRFLRWLYGDDPPGWLTISTFDTQPTQWFPANQLEQVATYCQAIARRYNCYFSLGMRKEKLDDGRGESGDVLGIPGLWVEIDIKHIVHKKVDLPETIEEALALVREALPLKPSLIILSGYGIHVYWLFRELWLFEDDTERQAAYHLLHRLQATIQATAKRHAWEVDSTFDLARVLRIPGTYNRNVPDDPKPVTILQVDADQRYNPSDLSEHLIEVDEIPNGSSASHDDGHELSRIDVLDLKIQNWLRVMIFAGKDPDYTQSDSSRSAAHHKVACELIKAGYDDDTILSILLDPRYAISERPREKGRPWTAGDLARAHAKLNGHQRPQTETPEPEASEPTDEERNSSEQDDDQQKEDDQKQRSAQQLGGVKAKADGYYRVRTIKEMPVETRISSFVVQPRLRIWVDGSEAVRANISSGKQNFGEVIIERHCWHSRGAFLKVLPSLDQWCVATDNEIQAIQALVASQKVPSKRGTRTLGLVDGVWVSDEGVFDVSGWIQDPGIVYLPPGGESPLAGRLRYRVQNQSERLPIAQAVYEKVWMLNELTVIGALIGWFFATPFKPHIHARLSHFPVLNVWGTMGAGKTSLLRLFWRLFGVESELLACTETEFSLLSLFSATSSIPLVFDEFKPYDMKPDQVKRFERTLRRVYDGDIEHRGRPDLRLLTYRLMAPVAVAGEVSVARQPAMRERIIPVSPSKTWLPEHEDARKAYWELVKLPLHAFASLFIEWSLRQDFAAMWAQADEALAESIERDMPERVRDGLRVISFGLRQYEQFGLEHGLPVPEQIDLGAICEGIVNQLVNADGVARVGLDVLLEHLASMAEMGRLMDAKHYHVDTGQDRLALRLDSCLAEYRRYAKDTASDDEVLSKESYMRQLRENYESKGYVLALSERVYFTPSAADRLRSVVISISKAEASHIDLGGFTRNHT
jgi:hypothetical protein